MNKEFSPRRFFFGTGELSLNGDPKVTLGAQSWMPDETTAYIRFCLSFAFPNVSNYGDGIHASVIGRSFTSMAGKPVNSNHKMVVYGSSGDAIIGTVMAVDYPAAPAGGWRTGRERKGAPNMTGVAALWLTASGTEQWIARYESKRKNVAVSMEVIYGVAGCGFAVSRDASGNETPLPQAQTPEEFWEAGWEYVPMSALLTPEQMDMDAKDLMRVCAAAPKGSLLRTRDFKAKRMVGGSLMGSGLVGSWTPPGSKTARDVYFMQGGMDGTVFYPGMGLVEQGAEPKAGIETMLAEDEEAAEMQRGLQEITAVVKTMSESLNERMP